MPKSAHERTLFLCGGLQGSGSSLISWCFLQRRDMDGVFDTAHDMVPSIPHSFNATYSWCKITTCCFQTSELKDYFAGLGWVVRPVLVVRDVREVWASLQGKQYGRNGTTAEDPPLRIRMLRFLSDWQRALDESWTIIPYEALIREPTPTLKAACESLDLNWDQDMLEWPKAKEQIADARYGNVNFLASRTGGLLNTIDADFAGQIKGPIADRDLGWLEHTFADYNQACDYPAHRNAPASREGSAMPTFDVTRRSEWNVKRIPPQSWLQRLGLRR